MRPLQSLCGCAPPPAFCPVLAAKLPKLGNILSWRTAVVQHLPLCDKSTARTSYTRTYVPFACNLPGAVRVECLLVTRQMFRTDALKERENHEPRRPFRISGHADSPPGQTQHHDLGAARHRQIEHCGADRAPTGSVSSTYACRSSRRPICAAYRCPKTACRAGSRPSFCRALARACYSSMRSI